MLRLISDVHGHHDQYLELIHNVEHSLQLGDFGFNYSVLGQVDPLRHRMIAGNHDNHDICNQFPHFLPKFGYSEIGGYTFFHMQGAFSIDWQERINYDQLHNTKSWWLNEQLSYLELEQAVELYCTTKPDLVITHDAPRSVVHHFGKEQVLRNFGYNPKTFTTTTSEALEVMFRLYKPKNWYFGHYHVTKKVNVEGTDFQCLAELNYIDLE